MLFVGCKDQPVAPYTGAWIEIQVAQALCLALQVAPYTGAWIEIRVQR